MKTSNNLTLVLLLSILMILSLLNFAGAQDVEGPTNIAENTQEIVTPEADVKSGTFDAPKTVKLTSSDGATIYYTTDGSKPTFNSNQYGGGWGVSGVEISETTTLKAIAVKEDIQSKVATYNYIIKVAPPEVIKGDGRYKQLPKVKLFTSTSDATIYYTTDGSTPNSESNKFSDSIELTGTTVLKAFAVKNDGSPDSEIVEFVYELAPDMAVLKDKKSIPAVIAEMTLDEKIEVIWGAGWGSASSVGAAGSTHSIPRLHITSMELADGPAGVRLGGAVSGTEEEKLATAWPNPLLLASTWNRDVMAEIGEATANEAKWYGVDIMLSPGMNIHRDPKGGRVFEYYSEDPFLTGVLAGEFMKAMQNAGVGATMKHYAANNAENNRMGINEIISERTLREMYLPQWEIAIDISDPWAAMSAYNKVNGTYCSENEYLNSLLEDEFEFNGLIMSDWGAYQGPQAFGTGFDLNTPGGEPGGFFGNSTRNDVKDYIYDGMISEADINSAVADILGIVIKTDTFKKQIYDRSEFMAKTDLSPELKSAGVELSKKAALEGIVLLKNDKNILPLAGDVTVGVAGANAVPKYVEPEGFGGAPSKGIIFEGAGSALVNVSPEDIISLVEGLEDGGLTVLNQNNSDEYIIEGLTVADANYLAANTDFGIVSLGRQGQEGSDVETIATKPDEIDMIQKLSKAYHRENKNLIVVLNVAHPIAVDSWNEYADAILYVGLPGTYGAEAITDILTGRETPSGKLADSWPKSYSDLPTSDNMPGPDQVEIEYTEGLYFGYRYFDQSEVEPVYPFGYGLSYTAFEYSNLNLSANSFNLNNKNETINVSVDVTNIGDMAGKEVVQLYLQDNEASVDRPDKELKGFVKTQLLEPGQTETLTFAIDKRDLSFFDEKSEAKNDGEWVAEAGTFTIMIGGNSDFDSIRNNGVIETFNLAN